MKTKSILLSLLCAGVLYVSAQAQTLSKLLIKNYTPSVVVRVYDVVQKVPLDEARQLQLANLYKTNDSIAYSVLQVTTNKKLVEAKKAQSQLKLETILTPAELDSYYNAINAPSALSIAKGMATAECVRLKGDKSLEKTLLNQYYHKYLELETTSLKYQNDSSLTSRLAKIVTTYDAKNEKTLSGYQGKAYFDTRTAILDSIKPIGKADKDKMLRTYTALCSKTNGASFADNYNSAMHSVITDTAYYAAIYRNETLAISKNNAAQEITNLMNKYQLPKETWTQLLPILTDKEKRLAIINYSFTMESATKKTLKNNTNSYFDSIVTIVLYRAGKQAPNSLFFNAVEQKKYLALSDAQVDTLVKYGLALDKMIRTSRSDKTKRAYDPKKYERDQLAKTLTDDQYSKFLILRNTKLAKDYAAVDWKTIVQAGVASAGDSAKYFQQLENYQLARRVAADRYYGDQAHRTANLQTVDRSRPEILNQLRKAQRSKNDTTGTEKGYVGTFQW